MYPSLILFPSDTHARKRTHGSITAIITRAPAGARAHTHTRNSLSLSLTHTHTHQGCPQQRNCARHLSLLHSRTQMVQPANTVIPFNTRARTRTYTPRTPPRRQIEFLKKASKLTLGRGEIPDEEPQQEEKREVASQPSRFLHIQPPPHQQHLRRSQIRHFAFK